MRVSISNTLMVHVTAEY